MSTEENNGKNARMASILFSIIVVIEGYFFIKDYKANTTGEKLLDGVLLLLFIAAAVQNFLKYKRAKGSLPAEEL